MSNKEANTLIEFYTSLAWQTAEKMRDLSTDAANELQQVFDQLEDRCFNVMKQVDVEHPRFVVLTKKGETGGFCGNFPPDLIEMLNKEGYYVAEPETLSDVEKAHGRHWAKAVNQESVVLIKKGETGVLNEFIEDGFIQSLEIKTNEPK